jgi:large subunit ribosomal protein L23
MLTPEQIILEPVLTEKSNAMREGEGRKYVFRVNPKANRLQIMDAARQLLSVNPVDCHVMNVRGKVKTSHMRNARGKHGTTSSWKKAILTLPHGETIDLFEGA